MLLAKTKYYRLLPFFPVCLAVWCHAAEPVLDLMLDDPKGLIKAKPEGISSIGPELNSTSATIGTGLGGRVLPLIEASAQAGADHPPAVLKIVGDGSLGSVPFLRMNLPAASAAKSVGVTLFPSSGAASTTAFLKGDGQLDGGFDFFFRIQKDSPDVSPKIILHARIGSLDFSLRPSPKQADGFDLSLTAKDAILLRADSKIGARPTITGKTVNAIPIEAGEIYHLAVTFQTASDGLVAVKLFLEKGSGAIKPDDSPALNEEMDFKITKPVADAATVGKVNLVLGVQDFSQTLDLSGFRIYTPAPDVFPGLATQGATK